MGGPGAQRHRPSPPGRRLEGGGGLEGGTPAETSPGSGARMVSQGPLHRGCWARAGGGTGATSRQPSSPLSEHERRCSFNTDAGLAGGHQEIDQRGLGAPWNANQNSQHHLCQ